MAPLYLPHALSNALNRRASVTGAVGGAGGGVAGLADEDMGGFDVGAGTGSFVLASPPPPQLAWLFAFSRQAVAAATEPLVF
jgi:hypothetical protein